jgi:hypothetical protein
MQRPQKSGVIDKDDWAIRVLTARAPEVADYFVPVEILELVLKAVEALEAKIDDLQHRVDLADWCGPPTPFRRPQGAHRQPSPRSRLPPTFGGGVSLCSRQVDTARVRCRRWRQER